MPNQEGPNDLRGVVKPFLTKHGPAPRSQVPAQDLTWAREHGIGIFCPYKCSFVTENVDKIVYLPSHAPEAVIRAWIEANRNCVTNIPRSTITHRIKQRYDDEWVDAWYTVADENGIASHQTAPNDPAKDPSRQCPQCGEKVRARKFVAHLRRCG